MLVFFTFYLRTKYCIHCKVVCQSIYTVVVRVVFLTRERKYPLWVYLNELEEVFQCTLIKSIQVALIG